MGDALVRLGAWALVDRVATLLREGAQVDDRRLLGERTLWRRVGGSACLSMWSHMDSYIYIYTYIYIYSASHCRYFTLLPLWLVAASRIAPTAPNSRRDTHLRDSTYFTFSLSFSFTCTLIYIDRFKIKEKDESLINM